MKRSYSIVAALALGLFAAGCVLTSGQIRIFFDLDSFTTTTYSVVTAQPIDLNDESEYQDNKDKLKDLSDLAVLGNVKNNGSNTIHVEIWMTPDVPQTYADAAALKADPNALKVWGPFTLAPGQTKQVDWNESAKLFSAAGKNALLDEAKGKGDGVFTLYAIAQEGTYDFAVEKGVLILVLDVGI